MFKRVGCALLLAFVMLLISGCGAIGNKEMGMSVIYGVIAFASCLILIFYLLLIQKKSPWFIFLMSCVAVTNVGYYILSAATTLQGALMANRLAYLGSVFLPLSMLMILLNVIKLRHRKGLPWLLGSISLMVFLVAASPGYLDIYYADVSLATVNGATVLQKVYGPWHILYLFYLLAYFLGTVGVVAYSAARGKLKSFMHTVVLAAAVLINMGVWLLEQLVRIDFELLSVSYIISELFLLSFDMLLQEQAKLPATPETRKAAPASQSPLCPVRLENAKTDAQIKSIDIQCAYLAAQLPTLTATERTVYDLYCSGKSSKEILALLHIKENTLKFHNKNIYSKLGVSSRKQLLLIASALKMKADPAQGIANDAG